MLDPNGKLTINLTYGKLLSRSQKIAYALLNRVGFKPTETSVSVKPGDRVALVFPNNDPLNFMCTFYGCIMAGLVPVPIEVRETKINPGVESSIQNTDIFFYQTYILVPGPSDSP